MNIELKTRAKRAAAELREMSPLTDRDTARVIHAELMYIVRQLAKRHGFKALLIKDHLYHNQSRG